MSETDSRRRIWDARYETGDLPWDSGRHDHSLEAVLSEYDIAPCQTLEIGCGTGTNAIWLAKRGFTVTAIDISPLALATARDKAKAPDVAVRFLDVDVHGNKLPDGPFDFVFDRGCFHGSDEQERDEFAAHIHAALKPKGLWFSLIGSADSPPREVGPPRLTAREIATHVEPRFEIVSLKATHFDSDQEDPPPAWACLMRKRNGVLSKSK